MSKKLLAKCHQENKERLQKKILKDTKIFPKKRKKKKQRYGYKRYKNLKKIKNKRLLSIEKNIIEQTKIP